MKVDAGRKSLFGGEDDWRSEDWKDSDDRVRGGISQSYLNCSKTTAMFTGTLDISTLGGAGFASQRTKTEEAKWDLSEFDGIEIIIDRKRSDKKKYTFIFKDELLSRDPDTGREQATTSWEHDFVVPTAKGSSQHEEAKIFIPWSNFTPTYRGRERKDAGKPTLNSVRRFSVMMRSFFGSQEGDFKLVLKSITACNEASSMATSQHLPLSDNQPSTDEESVTSGSLIKQDSNMAGKQRSIWDWVLGSCWKL